MVRRVAILEDDPERIVAMRACLAELLPTSEHHFFDHAATMIEWLGEHLGEVALISLDHDLPLVRAADGTMTDYGTGREVVDYLCTVNVGCPVIVHSSNTFCAPGMIQCLKDAGFVHARVYPHDDTWWVRIQWTEQIRAYLRDGQIAV